MTRALIALLLVCSLSAPALAEQLVRGATHVAHYIAMPSTELTPDIARAYGVTRSRKRGVLVINVQANDAPLVSVPAEVSGSVRNLIGQDLLRDMRTVTEQDAIYTIVEFGYSHLETVRFDLDIQPDGGAPIDLTFAQQFFAGQE